MNNEFFTYYFAFVKLFWAILVEMSPWFLLGFLFSGILKAFIPLEFMNRHLGKSNFSSVLKATLFGIPLPLCSCGVIPMASSLYKNGASKGAVSSFLISTPQTGIDSILVTYGMFGFPFALVRLTIALISGLFGGILTNLVFKKSEKERVMSKERTINNQPPTPNPSFQKKVKEIFHYGFVLMIQDLGKWIVLGLLLSTLMAFVIPDNYFDASFANTWKEFALMIILSVPLYVCATGSIPMAVTFALKGISPGAVLLFLMLGPATNITTLTILTKTLGGKFTLTYLFSMILCALGFGILVNEFLPQSWFMLSGNSLQEIGHNFGIMGELSAIILLILLFYNFFFSDLKFKTKTIMNLNTQEFNVEGMSCNHCKMSIEKNVAKIEGVSKVEVDLTAKNVKVEGNAPKQIIENCILELGFELK